MPFEGQTHYNMHISTHYLYRFAVLYPSSLTDEDYIKLSLKGVLLRFSSDRMYVPNFIILVQCPVFPVNISQVE